MDFVRLKGKDLHVSTILELIHFFPLVYNNFEKYMFSGNKQGFVMRGFWLLE
jgi:hypothetical protein